jgi:hypothetical protein
MTADAESPAATWSILAMADCVIALRPDWDPEAVSGALLSMRVCGWTPSRALHEIARVIAKPDGSPKELRDATRPPAAPPEPADPETTAAGAAMVRAALPNKDSDPT